MAAETAGKVTVPPPLPFPKKPLFSLPHVLATLRAATAAAPAIDYRLTDILFYRRLLARYDPTTPPYTTEPFQASADRHDCNKERRDMNREGIFSDEGFCFTITGRGRMGGRQGSVD